MSKVRLHRLLAQCVVALALAAPLTPLGIGTPGLAFSAAAPLGATVSVISLPVEVANANADALFAPAIDGQTLFVGDTVRTGPGGMALVTFFDGSESQLGGETQVQIEQVKATPAPQIAFLQTAGVTVNHIIPMPAEGSFRTDTPAATGLVRGTSYIVIVGPAGSCGAVADQPCAATLILLTDRNGHVGRVDVTANGASVPAVQLTMAGDAAAASNLMTTTAAHVEPVALAELESVAHVRNDPGAALTTEQHARAIAATLATVPAVVTTAPAGSPVDSPVQTPAATVSAPRASTTEHVASPPPAAHADDHTLNAGHANSEAHHVSAPAPVAAPSTDSKSAKPATSEATPARSDDSGKSKKTTTTAAATTAAAVTTVAASAPAATTATVAAKGNSGKSGESGKSGNSGESGNSDQ